MNSAFIKKYFAESALLFATLIWGATFVIVKNSVSDMSPMFFVGVRFVFAALILLPFSIKKVRKLPGKLIFQSCVLGGLLFLSFASQTAGLRVTSATKSAFITGTTVIFIPLFQILIEKRRPTLSNIAGSCIVLLGVVFLSSKGNSVGNLISEIGSDFNFGDFLTILCAITFAVQVVYLDSISKKIDFTALAFIQISTTAVLGIIASFFLNVSGLEIIHINYTWYLLLGLLYTAVLATVVALNIQARYQKKVSPTKAGIVYSFEPVFAAIFAYFMLGERISANGINGCILIFSGLIISEILDLEKLLKRGIKIPEESEEIIE